MEHIITAKKTTVTDGIRAYIEKRFSKFEKYVSDNIKVHTKIEVKDDGNRHKVEVTIPFGRQVLRAEANDVNMYTAIDNVEKTMARMLKKRKEKITQREQQSVELAAGPESSEPEYDITRVKTHKLHALTVQEACEAMEMIGHPFYAYMDTDVGSVCVVYIRDDGTCGQLIYE
jgi:putative sigma-54 modulation protein